MARPEKRRSEKSRADDVDERPTHKADAAPNPVWFLPVMVGLMLLGLIWILVFYLSDQRFPIPDIGGWNLVIGFGIAFLGFIMSMRWR